MNAPGQSPLPGESGKLQIPFQEPESAQALLSRVRQQFSPALAASLPALLAESPDPDSALLLFDRLIGGSAETLRLLQ